MYILLLIPCFIYIYVYIAICDLQFGNLQNDMFEPFNPIYIWQVAMQIIYKHLPNMKLIFNRYIVLLRLWEIGWK